MCRNIETTKHRGIAQIDVRQAELSYYFFTCTTTCEIIVSSTIASYPAIRPPVFYQPHPHISLIDLNLGLEQDGALHDQGTLALHLAMCLDHVT